MNDRYRLNAEDNKQWIIYDSADGSAVCVVWDASIYPSVAFKSTEKERYRIANDILYAMNKAAS